MSTITEQPPFHVMFLPYMAPGHMVPMIDIARQFAANGIKVTIITTPKNASQFQNSIDRDSKSGKDIGFELLPFPSEQVGLPEGCENMSATPTKELTLKFIKATDLFKPQLEKLFKERRPNCIASDYLFHWTVDIATELGIPRLAFSGSGFVNLCVEDTLRCKKPHENVESETEEFIVPGLPDQLKLTRSQLPDIVKSRNDFSALFDMLREAEKKSFGVLMNSFYELEPDYVDHFRNEMGKKAWPLGPVSLFNKDIDDKSERGDKISVNANSCINWLDSRKPNSVIYICFGSLTRFTQVQTTEIANAVLESDHSFIWVVGKLIPNNNDRYEDQLQDLWLPEGFENATNKTNKGLIIKGWAPQVLILEHPAIGGFLTHCGWNSVMEGVSAGVPMVTWPMFAEQFYNEKLVTQVIKFGVPVGNEVWKLWAADESPVINKYRIKEAVNAVMGDGDEAMEKRRKAKRLGEMAKKAVEEGGSSYNSMKALIEELRSYKPAIAAK